MTDQSDERTRGPSRRVEDARAGMPDAPTLPSEEIAHEADPIAPPRQEKQREGSLWGDAWRDLRGNPLCIVSAVIMVIFVLMAYFPSLYTWFYPGDPNPRHCLLSRSLQRPDATHWFGFDLQGCDYYARSVYGAKVSLSIGLLVTGFAFVIAVTLGSVAGYYGGLVDTLIARMTDIWFAIPVILGGVVILATLRDRTILGINLGQRGLMQVSLVLILLGWPTMLRLMRSQVIQTKEADYVEAARALGARDLRIITRHILPNAISPVIVYATITVGIIITAEAALSFLGVGLQLPAVSWGLMINGAQDRILQTPHLLFFPAIFLSLTVFSFILMGDALRDAFDPKLR